jgi:putative toxin-antitoxin system antitoxin component (TIGR02293 family)
MTTKADKRPAKPRPRVRSPRTTGNPLLLGLDPTKPIETHNVIRGGFTYKSLSDFAKASQLPLGSVAKLIDLPLSTLDRRKKSNRPLKPDESDRLYRLAQVFEKAVRLFEGNVVAARQWLAAPVRALGQQVPLELVQTAVGAQMVIEVIGRLEHGVFT